MSPLSLRILSSARPPRGSVLVMALIVASGIVIVGVEFAYFITQNIRLARNTDAASIARYAGESGLESALHQIRKEGRTTLRNLNQRVGAAEWTFRADPHDPSSPIDPQKFNDRIQVFEKVLLQKDDTVQLGLYALDQNGAPQALANLSKMSLVWEGLDGVCAAPGSLTLPGIETSVLVWDQGGETLNWQSAKVRKDFQQVTRDPTTGVAPKSITVDFNAAHLQTAGKPMVVRVKAFFCGLRQASITFLDTATPPALVPIQNYYLLAPVGFYRSVAHDERAIVPGVQSLSNLFDFILFSEEKVQKTD